MGRTVRRAGCRDRPIERLNDGPIPQINWPPERNRKVHRSTKRFHRIRHYGLLASAACKANIARAELIAIPMPAIDRAAYILAFLIGAVRTCRRYGEQQAALELRAATRVELGRDAAAADIGPADTSQHAARLPRCCPPRGAHTLRRAVPSISIFTRRSIASTTLPTGCRVSQGIQCVPSAHVALTAVLAWR